MSHTRSGFVLLLTAAVRMAGADDGFEYGTEYYRFSQVDLLSKQAIRIGQPEELPEVPGLSVGAAGDLVPKVALKLEGADEKRLDIGKDFAVMSRVSRPSYLYIVDFGSSGNVAEIYPAASTPAQLEAEKVLKLDGTKDMKWKVEGPTGNEYVLAFATSQSIEVPRRFLIKGPRDQLLGRMQDFKNEVKQICEEKRVDIGFAHVEFEVRDPKDKVTVASYDPGPGEGQRPTAPPPAVPALASKSTFPPEKIHALVIGVSQYKNAEPAGVFRNLVSPVKDAAEFQKGLVEKMKVPAQQVHLLTDAAATRDGILKELAWLKAASKGQYAYLYFSGHGTYDPLSTPGGAGHRALVPHDFDLKAAQAGGRGNLVYDTEIGQWIEGLETAGNVMIFDACYSGAVTKAIPKNPDLRPKGFFIPPPASSKLVVVREGKPVALTTTKKTSFIIMASQFDQQAWEDQKRGHSLLTLHILEQFDRGMTGRELFQSSLNFVSSYADAAGHTQVPALVDTVGDYKFVPFARN